MAPVSQSHEHPIRSNVVGSSIALIDLIDTDMYRCISNNIYPILINNFYTDANIVKLIYIFHKNFRILRHLIPNTGTIMQYSKTRNVRINYYMIQANLALIANKLATGTIPTCAFHWFRKSQQTVRAVRHTILLAQHTADPQQTVSAVRHTILLTGHSTQQIHNRQFAQ